MSNQLDDQIIQLKQTIADIESQRLIMGDAAVDISLEPFRQKLAELETQAESTQEKPPVLPTRQRKLVTLLYMDVVGSTAMTQHLDPEDTLEIMDNALPLLAVPIKTHGGHVTRYTGDGFKAVFGDPVAREDDPEQAIRAGLDIIKEAEFLAQQLVEEWGMEDFQVRIGIDTGLAALGGQTEAEDTVMGRVVNLAVRIESAAPPGGLLISHNTYRHVRGVFNVEPQDPISAKGFPEPVPVYMVREIKPRALRIQTRGVEGIETRMVGRETELKHLQDALLTAIEEGEGQVITITGEAGVGKSRLLYEFDNWIELLPEPPIRIFQGHSRQESLGLPYSLLRDLFAFRFQILDDDSGEQARHKIETGFCVVFGEDEESVMRAHILGQLLGFDFSASPHLKGVLNDPEQLRNRGLMYLIQYFQAISKDNPIVVFLEDIHWGDNSSLDVISRLGEHTPELRLLIVGAARPTLFERRPYWGEGLEYHTLLELQPLSKHDSRQLVAEILKLAEDIPTQLRELVVSGAEGNPFYVEELIKMLIEDGVIIPEEQTWRIELRRLEQVDVPSTLAGVLQARLDSLPEHERIVLQQASVVGRLFWDRIVSYIQAEGGNGGDPQLIPKTLTSLRNRELVYRHEESAFVGAVEYLFKHDVLREVTYESVLKRLRKTYHGLVADWLIANSSDRISEYYGLIAEHLLVAGRNEQACDYFINAGLSALASYASAEAENYFQSALELSPAESLHATVLAGLGEALYRQGKEDQAAHIWRRAIDFFKELGEFDKMGDIYSRLSWLLWYTGGYHKAWKLCQEGLELLEGKPDSSGYARLLAEAGRTTLFSNVFDQVKPLCKRAIEMSDQMGNLEVNLEARITLALTMDIEREKIPILEEVAGIAEANGLLFTAARAHNNIGVILGNNLFGLDSAHNHYLRAIEFNQKMGNIEAMLFLLSNVYHAYIDLGELNSVEGKVIEILQSSNAPKTRVDKFLNSKRPFLMSARGEWSSALEDHRVILKYLQDEGSIQQLVIRKVNIADNILELNRFGYYDDISDAESVLLGSIDQDPSNKFPQFYLVIVYIRQDRLDDARDQYAQSNVDQASSRPGLGYEFVISKIELEFACAEECWKEAISICESSIDTYQSGGYRWDWARRLIDLGDALVGRSEPGDLERARETYQQSLDVFTEMGAPGYIKVLEERLVDL
jgi:class 3 adenylate cyclase/tetratricopeptide (TPR) repeat protein